MCLVAAEAITEKDRLGFEEKMKTFDFYVSCNNALQRPRIYIYIYIYVLYIYIYIHRERERERSCIMYTYRDCSRVLSSAFELTATSSILQKQAANGLC